jgi:hypothetical protein
MNTKLKYEGETYDLNDLGVRYNTITFYTAPCYECSGTDEECKVCDEYGYVDAETNFGTCDLTGWKGNVVPCIGLDADGEIVHFKVLDSFVHGRLGKLAGAF